MAYNYIGTPCLKTVIEQDLVQPVIVIPGEETCLKEVYSPVDSDDFNPENFENNGFNT